MSSTSIKHPKQYRHQCEQERANIDAAAEEAFKGGGGGEEKVEKETQLSR